MPPTTTELRLKFFDWTFGRNQGYVCIAHAPRDNPRRGFRQQFFHWPMERAEINEFVDVKAQDQNVWFAVNLFEKPERLKEHALPHNLVWADLDSCRPDQVDPPPSLVIISSPNRYQALWKIDQDIPPDVAEDYSKRIAYMHREDGADITGWDLTQLLRVPFTKNLKYDNDPRILINKDIARTPTELLKFEDLPQAPLTEEDLADEDMPNLGQLPSTEHILYKYSSYINRSLVELYEVEPQTSDDWSSRMWKLINLAFEAGMEKEEVFSVAMNAACNKYRRDHRPIRYLWKEVLKAYIVQQRITGLTGDWEPLLMPELVKPTEQTTTFIDNYYDWASNATDAVPEYHRLVAAILLSSVLSDTIRLETRYGKITTNLWGMVLGDSTLTRKTTAMEMGMSILYEVDKSLHLASDGSVEGLLTGLSARPHRVSVFYRDEVSGFFDAMNKKDYLSGMQETFTKLYDVPPYYARLLRKETIEVESPYFIFFAGGITDQVFQTLADHYITSGFLPRFLTVIGKADINRIRRTGPPVAEEMTKRQKLIDRLTNARENYTPLGSHGMIKIGDQEIPVDGLPPTYTRAILTEEAWKRYGDIEHQLVIIANDSYYNPMALPMFERLSRSLLKLAVLLSAVDQLPNEGMIEVTEQDIINSAGYVQRWGKYSIELLVNAGITQNMRLVEKIKTTVERKPGILSSNVMRMYHMNSRDMKDVLQTLEDRGEIKMKKQGRGLALWPIT